MTKKRKVIDIREITIDEIKKTNHNRNIWINRLLVQARIDQYLISPYKSTKSYIDKKEQLYNKALIELEHSNTIYQDKYCKLRIYYLLALFNAKQYPKGAFLIEEYEKKDNIKTIKKYYK